MFDIRRSTATLGAAALIAAPITVLGAAPASADAEREKEFRVAGAEVDFSVEKDDGRFEVEVDLDDARPGSRYRVILKHDGKRFHKRVHRADGDGDIEVSKDRRNTKGKDVFKVKVKKIGGDGKSRTIRMR